MGGWVYLVLQAGEFKPKTELVCKFFTFSKLKGFKQEAGRTKEGTSARLVQGNIHLIVNAHHSRLVQGTIHLLVDSHHCSPL